LSVGERTLSSHTVDRQSAMSQLLIRVDTPHRAHTIHD